MKFNMFQIREETPADFSAVRNVVTDAFESSEFGHNGEADLVDALRNNCEGYLSLVADADGDIVGHLLFTPVVIRLEHQDIKGMGLAPVAVATGHQQQGIGTKLIRNALARLDRQQCPFVVVLGHPDYYSRFEFRPAGDYKVRHGFPEIPQDVFFIRVGSTDFNRGRRPCLARYRDEFGPQPLTD